MTWSMAFIIGGTLAMLASFLGLGYYQTKRKGQLENELEHANAESELKDKIIDAMANPADKPTTVDRMRSGDF